MALDVCAGDVTELRCVERRVDDLGTRSVAVLIIGALLLAAGACGGDRGTSSPPVRTQATEPESQAMRSARLAMVEQHVAGLGIKKPQVLEAMRAVPRHRFVPRNLLQRAYDNRPLPIGLGQTISQPYIVALMTELLDLEPGDKVLEIGTGSGYQAAVLAEITDKVWSIEIIPELATSGESTLRNLGYPVMVKQADGYFGWPEHGPFDGIIVTAAPDHMPQPLIQQLAEGGRLVVPVGPPGSYQTLWRVTKRDGRIMSENITDVIFVPLVRERD
jgi:protein-L-isoaspartate(D-aspartate) O-methyltransferase